MTFIKIFCLGFLLIQGNLFSMHSDFKIPVVYHDGYFFNYADLPESSGIPFESDRHSKIFNALICAGVVPDKIYKPSDYLGMGLKQVHSQGYLESLKVPQMLEAYLKLPGISHLSSEVLDKCLVEPQRLATAGTWLACRLALRNGWAINLGGGFNLAMPDNCVGWSLYSDVGIAVHNLWLENQYRNILIVDLSAIQSDAYAHIFKCYGEPEMINVNVHLFQMYNAEKFKHSSPSLSGLIQSNLQLKSDISGSEYNRLLEWALAEIIKEYQPSLIIYVAGTDIFKGDTLGGMAEITEQDIIDRDALVFSLAEMFNKPIAMILGNGYSDQSSTIAANSIKNILRIKGVLK